MPATINRRDWLRQGSLAALGLSLSFPALAKPGSTSRFTESETPLVNLGSNENPYGISPKAKQAILDNISSGNRYQFNVPVLQNFKATMAKYVGVAPENILVTAGSTEVLAMTACYIARDKGNIICADPTFRTLPNTAKKTGLEVNEIPVTAEKGVDLPAMYNAINSNTKLVYLVNPNNPTGTLLKPSVMKQFCEDAGKKTVVMIDEAYLDFVDAPDNESMIPLVVNHPNIIITRTFSKIHGMAGLRIGVVIAHATVINQLQQAYFAYSQLAISNLAMNAAMASIEDEAHRAACKQKNAAAREYTVKALAAMNYHSVPSYTNFLLFPLGNYAGDFAADMLKQNIVLRSMQYPDGKYCRVSIGTMEEMQQFIKVMKQIHG